MKKPLLYLASLLSLSSLSACATWEGVQKDSADAWEATKETSSDVWDKTKEVSQETWESTKEVVSGE